jgi:hypothetical protein
MTAGVAGMTVDSKGVIVIECTPTTIDLNTHVPVNGSIFLRNPTLPLTPTVWLNDTSISLSLGPGAAPTVQVVMSETSIVLRCGPLCWIQMTPDTIQLFASKIQYGGELQHLSQATVKNMMATATANLGGPMVNIGPPQPGPPPPPPPPQPYDPPGI